MFYEKLKIISPIANNLNQIAMQLNMRKENERIVETIHSILENLEKSFIKINP